ncbi:hypothetical protein [Streptomyces phaeofaciens]|uniref:hypothetical protein n=1 Tax=Streptomyces phaeofaciens TaxID=68254 RepID=UPI0036858801
MNQHNSAGMAAADAPIYARLVAELGDVPAEVERAAAQILKESDRVIDFSSLHAA